MKTPDQILDAVEAQPTLYKKAAFREAMQQVRTLHKTGDRGANKLSLADLKAIADAEKEFKS